MSNTLSIAAVTATLRTLLNKAIKADLPGAEVTAKPPDKARDNFNGNQVNVFLYAEGINAAFRNGDMPGRVNPGETGQPPLPLVLYYLITAYGNEDDDILAHTMLNRAMGVLQDHPVLSPDEFARRCRATTWPTSPSGYGSPTSRWTWKSPRSCGRRFRRSSGSRWRIRCRWC